MLVDGPAGGGRGGRPPPRLADAVFEADEAGNKDASVKPWTAIGGDRLVDGPQADVGSSAGLDVECGTAILGAVGTGGSPLGRAGEMGLAGMACVVEGVPFELVRWIGGSVEVADGECPTGSVCICAWASLAAFCGGSGVEDA